MIVTSPGKYRTRLTGLLTLFLTRKFDILRAVLNDATEQALRDKIMRRHILLSILMASAVSLAGCATSAKKAEPPKAEMTKEEQDRALAVALLTAMITQGRAPGVDVEKIAEGAAQFPLGTVQNPVRVNMPKGQKAYLARLNCSSGATPLFKREGNFGAGPYGSIIDGYQLSCDANPLEELIYMDMYHPTHIENDPVPGFTID